MGTSTGTSTVDVYNLDGCHLQTFTGSYTQERDEQGGYWRIVGTRDSDDMDCVGYYPIDSVIVEIT